MPEAPFPFSAVVGQDDLKTALMANAVDAAVGGVLVEGPRGTGKSTLARSLSEILPEQAFRGGCPVRCSPDRPVKHCPFCRNRDEPAVFRDQPRFVELPLGATPEQITGSLNVREAVEHGRQKLEAGLLARANRGILYVDEVNLLPDQLVDLLLDAAASGTNRVERDGLSVEHPAEFILVGTMNPEEGRLRPQLRDRFGLSVESTTLTDPQQRAEVARRANQFEDDPEAFRDRFVKEQQSLRQTVIDSRDRLPGVSLNEGQSEWIAEKVLESGAEGHRADIIIRRTSRVLAALDGRPSVNQSDLERAYKLTIRHREPSGPESPPDPSGPSRERDPFAEDGGSETGGSGESTIPPQKSKGLGGFESRDENGDPKERQPDVARRKPLLRERDAATSKFNLGDSLLNTARRLTRTEDDWSLKAEDLVFRPHAPLAPRLILWLVDTSASMARRRSVGFVKSAIRRTRMRRDRTWMSLLEFRSLGGRVLVGPTRRHSRVRSVLEGLPVGGGTPMKEGLTVAHQHAQEFRNNHHKAEVRVIALSDGRVTLSETLVQRFNRLCEGADVLLVDVEPGREGWGVLPTLAQRTPVQYRQFRIQAA